VYCVTRLTSGDFEHHLNLDLIRKSTLSQSRFPLYSCHPCIGVRVDAVREIRKISRLMRGLTRVLRRSRYSLTGEEALIESGGRGQRATVANRPESADEQTCTTTDESVGQAPTARQGPRRSRPTSQAPKKNAGRCLGGSFICNHLDALVASAWGHTAYVCHPIKPHLAFPKQRGEGLRRSLS